MGKHLNSASRLLRILQQVDSNPDKANTADTWATILGIVEQHPVKRAVLVTEFMGSIHREIGYATDGLLKENFSKDLYERHFNRIEHAISPLILSHAWSQVKQYVTPEVLTALSFCSEILPDEEVAISNEELNEIRTKLNELRAVSNNPELSERISQLIQHHISLIERAIAEYEISGAKAFRDAGRAAMGELIEVKDEIGKYKGSDSIGALDAVWRKVNSVADVAIKVEKMTKIGQEAWDVVSKFLS